jgi:hypothetical protein
MASGQSKLIDFSGGAPAASASPSAQIPVYIARRAVLSGPSGSSTTQIREVKAADMN